MNTAIQRESIPAHRAFHGLINSGAQTFSNWGQSRTTKPAEYVEPVSYADVQAVVADAERFPTPVHPVGALLSVTSTIVNDGVSVGRSGIPSAARCARR